MSKTPQAKSSQENPSVLMTGANGLVGSRFVNDFQDKYQFDNLDLRHPTRPVDITKPKQVMQAFEQSKAKSVIHLAAFTDVTAAWEQRGDKLGLAYQVNVVGTQNIIDACAQTNKHLIHISTAYVFDGQKENKYGEDDQPNPIEWYGQTKWEAEKLVMNSQIDWTILRIDQPFRSDPFEKTDIAHRILKGLKNDSLYPMFTDHYFGPTFINDFAKVLDFFVRKVGKNDCQGLFHASSGEKWSDYDFALAIKEQLADKFELTDDVKKGSLKDYLQAVNRPYQKNTSLDVSKLESLLDFELKSVEDAIAKLKLK